MNTAAYQDFQLATDDGVSLAGRHAGLGEPVLFLHGSGGGLHSWAGIADRLADEYQVWLVARRGYGPSGQPAPGKRFADEVADVRRLVRHIGATHGTDQPAVHLVGASYGASLALHAGLDAPGGLRSLALFEPPLFAAGPRIVPLARRYAEAFELGDSDTTAAILNEVTQVPAEIVAAFAAAAPARPDPVEARRSGLGWRHDLDALAADGTDLTRWSGVRLPTLLMTGTETWSPMPETMRGLAAALPQVTLVPLAGQSHFATMTAPDLVADTIRTFLAERG
ncbi:alpha/beta hydrolase [Actinocatenispora sera]|uniref:alpha/beta fold hydrolase n=1 Tax=Actinocatenispora sera TaxID=390989 RepID=UPI0033F8B6FF